MDIDLIRRQAEAPVVAAAGDVDSVAADLADAFTDDVMFNWFMRADSRRAAAQLSFFGAITRMGLSTGRIERPAGGGAAAVWLPFEAVGPLPLLTQIRLAPVMLGATGLSRISRLQAVLDDMDRHHPMDRPHAYLWFLGVSRPLQGHGIGSRLLKVATDRLDTQGLPAYLETQTERNLALYRRHGFEVTSEHKPRPDAPPLWSMWREPLGEHSVR